MKLSLILQAIDRWSKPTEHATKATTGLNRAVETLGRTSNRSRQGVSRFFGDAQRGERTGQRLGATLKQVASAGFERLRVAAGRAGKAMKEFGDKSASWLVGKAGGLLGGLVTGGIAAGIGGIVAFGYKVVTAGLMFEKFRTQLTGLMGSVAAGDKAMAWVTDFARTTPYEIDQVMQAFVQLKAYGIDPADGSLKTLGDTAAGMGKDLMQAVEMIADAQTGEFERLKEFGVKASQKGDQVTFSFMKNGKTMTKLAKKNGADITKALYGIFNDRFAGGMDRLSATTAGKWSNVMDRLTISAKRVWEAGIGSAVNTQLDRLSAWIDKAEANGTLKKWATETGAAVGGLIKQLASADWKRFAGDVSTLAGAFRTLAEWSAKATRVASTGNVWDIPVKKPTRAPGPWDAWEMMDPWGAKAGQARDAVRGMLFGRPKATPAPPPPAGGLKKSSYDGGGGTVRVELLLPEGVKARTRGMIGNGIQLNTGRAMSSVA
jgi:hypothetical protein